MAGIATAINGLDLTFRGSAMNPPPQKMLFSSAGHAVCWAENVLNRQDFSSQMGVLMRQCIQQVRGGGMSKSDARDLAETISVLVSEIMPPMGPAYRFVHGQSRQWLRMEVADVLAHDVWRGPGEYKHTLGLYRQIAGLVIIGAKMRERYGKRLFAKSIARELGIRRQALYEQGLLGVINEQRDLLTFWLESAGQQMDQALHERGLL